MASQPHACRSSAMKWMLVAACGRLHRGALTELVLPAISRRKGIAFSPAIAAVCDSLTHPVLAITGRDREQPVLAPALGRLSNVVEPSGGSVYANPPSELNVDNAEKSFDYRGYRQGRRASGRAAAGQRLRGTWRQTPLLPRSTARASITCLQDPHKSDTRLFLHYGDLTDSTTNLIRLVQGDPARRDLQAWRPRVMSRSASKPLSTPRMPTALACYACWKPSAS